MSSETAVRIVLTALTLAVDASAILLVAWVAILANRRRSSVRHAVWVAAFAALLLLPVLSLSYRAAQTVPINYSLSSMPMAVGVNHTDWQETARLLLGMWISGSAILFSWIGVAVLGLRSLCRSSEPIEWREGEYETLTRHFNLRRPVALRMCRPGVQFSAMTWGVRR